MLYVLLASLFFIIVCCALTVLITSINCKVLNPHYKGWMGLIPILNMHVTVHCACTQEELAYGKHKFLFFYTPNWLPTVIQALFIIETAVIRVIAYLFKSGVPAQFIMSNYSSVANSSYFSTLFLLNMISAGFGIIYLIVAITMWIRIYKRLSNIDPTEPGHAMATIIAILALLSCCIGYLFFYLLYKPSKKGLKYLTVEEFDELYDFY